MSARIDALFARTRAEKRAALVAYLCIGDPSIEVSIAIARALLDAGVDLLELGAPFSDPTADGPTIERASVRAIAAGSSMRAAIEVGRALRSERRDVPLVLFGYANPIFARGEVAIVDAVADAGIDAMLVVDLPPEEGETLRAQAKNRSIDVIPLLTPTSSADRVTAAAKGASGFAYYVSVTGVTGALDPRAAGASADPFDAAALAAKRLREAMKLPVVVGFGIDSAEKARRAAAGADGIVVGSAIVRAIEEARGDKGRAIEGAVAVVRAIKVGCG